jgi:hypothetical protein
VRESGKNVERHYFDRRRAVVGAHQAIWASLNSAILACVKVIRAAMILPIAEFHHNHDVFVLIVGSDKFLT